MSVFKSSVDRVVVARIAELCGSLVEPPTSASAARLPASRGNALHSVCVDFVVCLFVCLFEAFFALLFWVGMMLTDLRQTANANVLAGFHHNWKSKNSDFSLSAVVYTLKIKHSMLCVTGAYLRDITNTIFASFHLNVNRLSVCCSCF